MSSSSFLAPAGTTRADGETVGFETEGTAIYDTMCFVKNEVGGGGVVLGKLALFAVGGCFIGNAGMLQAFHGSAACQQPGHPRCLHPSSPHTAAATSAAPHRPLQVHTVGVGVAIGQSCLLLSAGEKGKRFMLEHATAMLHQPRVPPTGQRQAIEVQIKWREVRVVGCAGGRAGVRGGEL